MIVGCDIECKRFSKRQMCKENNLDRWERENLKCICERVKGRKIVSLWENRQKGWVLERERNRVLDRKIESKREKESLREKWSARGRNRVSVRCFCLWV